MSEMIDRVATRLGDLYVPSNPYTFRDLFVHTIQLHTGPCSVDQRLWRESIANRWLQELAREALVAARKPTEAMVNAASSLYPRYDDPHESHEDVWDTMISAALSDERLETSSMSD